MFKKILSFGFILMLGVVLVSCNSNNSVVPFDDGTDSGWNIPVDQIISGGPPKDGIPSLFSPPTIPAVQANYLSDSDLVVGIVVNGQARAYPHTIMDWHEVVNEQFDFDKHLTVSFCPLTGTGIVFDGNNAGQKLTFGVSGLLYNNNLIMFDRQTDSNWPQMRLQSDQGTLRNTKQIVYPSIETSWGTWKKLYPNTVILSTDTGFNRPYDRPGSAYPGYTQLNSSPLFANAVSFVDRRLPPKQRVHGVFLGEGLDDYFTKVYVIDTGREKRVINDNINNKHLLVINDGINNFAVSYWSEVNGSILTFRLSDNANDFPFTIIDNETGSTWNVLGEATDGALAGTKLEKTLSYNAYWFAWGTFFIGAEIYQE
ncbi:MAG: DUF3179 domain-containing protein [bacterium]